MSQQSSTNIVQNDLSKASSMIVAIALSNMSKTEKVLTIAFDIISSLLITNSCVQHRFTSCDDKLTFIFVLFLFLFIKSFIFRDF